MAKRIFELPRQDQLTKEQRRVLRLPKDGQYLIVGAPGTGKSVVALLRLQNLINVDLDNVHFLTFNHVLNHANQYLVKNNVKPNMDTAMSWFYKFYFSTFDTFVPEEASYNPDYETIKNHFELYECQLKGHSFIIDEGQDLPPGWYESIEALQVENFFIVADQNQQITEQHSSRVELQECLGIEAEQIIELKENWRNTTPIATFCSYFYTDKSSPKPDIPNRPSANIPILYEYDTLDKVKEQILKEYDLDPSKLIGVFVATETKRDWWTKELGKDDKKRNNPPPIISTYYSFQKGNVNIDFGSGGIVILNDKSVKGIEFDTVFIQTDGFTNKMSSEESLKKRLYVMASRAREKLYLFKNSTIKNIIDDILPSENEMIKFKIGGNEDEVELQLLKRRKL